MFTSNHKFSSIILSLSLMGLIISQILLLQNNKPVLETPITSWESQYSLINGSNWYIDSKYAKEHNLITDDTPIEFIYGPFVPLSVGSYIIDISYISTSNQSLRPYAFEKEDSIIKVSDCILDNESIHKLCLINVLENLDSFEVRINYDGNGVLNINSITIREANWLYFYVLRNIFLIIIFSVIVYIIITSIYTNSFSKSRMVWLDYAKGICILLVLLGHTFNFPYHWFVYGFHMPFFFITAGYLFKRLPFIDQTKKIIKNYAIPYLPQIIHEE